jgi:hypothetical protein
MQSNHHRNAGEQGNAADCGQPHRTSHVLSLSQLEGLGRS